MDDEADVWFVNAQPEGDGRHDDTDAAGHKVILHLGSIRDAGVVVVGDDAMGAQQRGQLLAAGAGAGVDDAAARLGLAEGQQATQFVVGVAGVEDLQSEVGAGDVAGNDAHIAQVVDDVPTHAGWSRRGQRQKGWIAQCPAGLSDVEVIGPEVVAPHADAVRFVNHQPVDACPSQRVQERRLAQPLRRGVDQPVDPVGGLIQPPA